MLTLRSLGWCYREPPHPAGVFTSYLNCRLHLSTSITAMIAQASSSHHLPPTLPSSFPRWRPLRQHDAASLTAATKAAEGAFKGCKHVCVHDYPGNEGLRVAVFLNDGKCETPERWDNSLAQHYCHNYAYAFPQRRNTHPWVAVGTIRRVCSHDEIKVWHIWSQRCVRWMEEWIFTYWVNMFFSHLAWTPGISHYLNEASIQTLSFHTPKKALILWAGFYPLNLSCF